MEEIYKKISNESDFGPDDTGKSEIQEFFVGQSIFLTGSTGFLGKCFVEKLLRSCPGIKKLYLLIRPHKQPVKERLFEKLRKLQPNFMSKVVVIEGNLMENGMNLSDEDRKMIVNEVTLMIHNASNVKFDGRTSLILRCNVLGTKYMLDLAKELISTYQEPIPSWCGNINGPAWALLGGGLGVLHTGYTVRNTMDLIPADMCTNALLAITWDILKNRKENIGDVMVFNYGSSTVNPINFQRFGDIVTPRGQETPSAKMIAPHFILFTPYFYWFFVVHIFVHFIPAVIADIALLITRRKPRAVSIFWKLTSSLHMMFYFLNTNWRIHIHETQKVWDRMNERDRHLFFCDFRLFDWITYGYSYWAGLRVYVLDDPMTTLPAARKKYKIFQGLYEIFKAMLYTYILYYSLNYLLIIMSPLKIYALQKYTPDSF
ncbi:hypothetical protein PV326_008262 [Microctonus aethiopoides]|nr:hypothetical protein PV326_008262 [Microctonus aethiopoides]